MTDIASPVDSSGESFNAILAGYFERVDGGEVVDQERLLAAHPEHADELRSYFNAEAELAARAPRPSSLHDEPTLISASSEHGVSTRREDENEMISYFGDYELLDELARGGMGVVYKVRQVSVNRTVALKMILSGKFASAAEVQRFRIEAESAANLDHPNIVPIYEVGDHQGQHYFSMKLIDGPSLAAVLQQESGQAILPDTAATVNWRRRLLPDERLQRHVKMMIKVGRAVHYAHQRGIVHRDLKPANILVDADGQPHVTDFGLARRTTGESHLTETGVIVGTPAYMAPEQAAGRKDSATTAADIYSLGAMLYELLTRRPPFRGETPLDTLRQVLEQEPVRPGKLNARVDSDLEAICLKCLEKKPEQRYSSAAALADDLENWLAGEALSIRPPSVGYLIWRWLRRNLQAAVWMVVIGLASGIGWNLIIPGWWDVPFLANVHDANFPSLERLAILNPVPSSEPIRIGLAFAGLAFSATGVGLLIHFLVQPRDTWSDLTAGISTGLVGGLAVFIFGFGAEMIWSHNDLRGHVSGDLQLFADAVTAAESGGRARDVIWNRYPDLRTTAYKDFPEIPLRKKIDIELRLGMLSGILWGTAQSLALALTAVVVQTLAAGYVGRRSTSIYRMAIPYLELVIGGLTLGFSLTHSLPSNSFVVGLMAAVAVGGVLAQIPWWCRWSTYAVLLACSGLLQRLAQSPFAQIPNLLWALLYALAARYLLRRFNMNSSGAMRAGP